MLKTKTITIGIYLSDYGKVQKGGFKKLAKMVGDHDRGTFTDETIIYKSLRLPASVVEELARQAYEIDKSIVAYTAGVLHSLVN